MRTTVFERLFIIGISLFLNKLFILWLIGASNILALLGAFVLLILNFMILAKSIDKVIDVYEESRKKRVKSMISRLMER